ncbi:MAG: ABC transporter ATP-binding protein [Candidatus Binatia bacterium]|jgi:ATP-binding cassette, subfamily B, bacterial MsbA
MTPTRIFLRLVGECRAYPVRIAVILLSLAALAGAQFYLTWLVRLGVEPLTRGDSATVANLWRQGAVTAALLIAALFTSRYLLSSVNQSLVQRLRDRAQRQLLVTEVAALREFRSGELVSRIFNDAGVLAGFVRDVLKRLVGETLIVVGGLALMFYLHWRLALATCVVAPLVAVLLNELGGIIRRRGVAAQREIGRLTAILNEQLRGVTTVKGYQAEGFERDRFSAQNAAYRAQVMRGEQWAAVLVAAVSVVGGTALFGIIWYGSQQVIQKHLTSGELLAFCLYAAQTIEPLRRLSEVHGMLQGALAAAARVYEVIDFPRVEAQGRTAMSLPVRGALRFEDVRFRYRADEPVLAGVTLSIAPMETVGVVAASGGGKSTIANLLMRFCDPDQGRILLDGVALRTLRLADLRRAVVVVEQDPFIFSGALIDNIRYGSWHASTAAITAAVSFAGLEPLVSSLPGGLHAVLREAGRDLSGGQKQRIALARAVVRDPAVLVLDEATSALDSDSERQIFVQLQDWLRRRTVLVMAHRLATIRRFERVIVLEGGRVVGDGSVSRLLSGCPAFERLFAEQIVPLGAPMRAGVV